MIAHVELDSLADLVKWLHKFERWDHVMKLMALCSKDKLETCTGLLAGRDTIDEWLKVGYVFEVRVSSDELLGGHAFLMFPNGRFEEKVVVGLLKAMEPDEEDKT
jgi:hypothetical protein